jgi:hypothetical protein
MFTYNYTLAATTLPSGRRLYLEWGDTVRLQGVAVATTDGDDLRFLKLNGLGQVDLPFHVAGDVLFEVDVLWTQADHRGFVYEALLERDADWMSESLIDDGDERRGAIAEALGEALDAGDIDEERYEREREILDQVPQWFLALDEEQLDEVAALPTGEPDRDPPLAHTFAPWQRPTYAIFADPDKAAVQHIVAAWIVGKFD